MEKLSSENILKYISQEDILSFYLGLPILYGKKFKNPFRKDRHPDCSFSMGTWLYFRDYAQPHYGGNCFQICALYYGLNLPVDFYKVCQRINNDFKIGLDDGHLKDYTPLIRKEQEEREISPLIFSDIKVRIVNFNQQDLDYWAKYEITETQLLKYDTFRGEKVWINDGIFYFYQEKDLCFAYWFSEREKFQIYKPFETKSRKWRTNFSGVDGEKWLPEKGKHLFITKSRKDLIILSESGYPSIRFGSEHSNLEENYINQLKERFDDVIINFDSDNVGREASIRLTQKYNLKWFNTPNDCGAKDISDFVEKYGKQELIQLIKQKVGG